MLLLLFSGSALLRPDAVPALARPAWQAADQAIGRTAQVSYIVQREMGRDLVRWGHRENPILTTGHFQVYYPVQYQKDAEMVARLAEEYLPRVAARLGAGVDGGDLGTDLALTDVPLILSPDSGTLAGALGLASGQAALGAYYRGSVWVLAPRAWYDWDANGVFDAEEQRSFLEEGPVVHELAHLVLDERTQGNYPAWFSEGVAQYIEWRETGYEWIEPANSLDQGLYSLDQLGGEFDSLPNQALAYRQSFLVIRYLVAEWGEEGLRQVIDDLSAGHSLDGALWRLTGLTRSELERDWHRWLSGKDFLR